MKKHLDTLFAVCAAAVLFNACITHPLIADEGDAGPALTEIAAAEGGMEIEAGTDHEGIVAIPGDDERMTFNLRNVPLQDFFAMVSEKTGLRFLVKPEIKQLEVTAFLPDTTVSIALEAILTIYDLEAREIQPGILLIDIKTVKPFDPVIDMEMELITLKYHDAEDIKATLEPFLSTHGKVVVVERSGFTGWEGAGGVGTRRGDTAARRRKVESRTLIIRERADVLEIIKPIIKLMDVQPEQVLISAHIIEVKRDDIRDIGFDWSLRRGDLIGDIELGAWALPDPALADPGLGLNFMRVDGRRRGELEAFFRILEEEAGANILSAPRLLAVDSQECSIMVGERFPILLTDVNPETGQRTSSLDYYEDVGIQLNVIPRLQHDGHINMIIHPIISAQTDWVEARGEGNILLARYPVIDTREAETQISIEDGQTIVIGGLIKEQMVESTRVVPMLHHIPLLGHAFRRDVKQKEKIDLLIFISADIISAPGESTAERARKMGEGIVRVYENEVALRTYPDRAGTAADITADAPYNIGDEVTLKTEPDTGYEFVRWTGHLDLITEGTPEDTEITFIMKDENVWFTANYRLIDYTLELKADPEEYGTVRDRTGRAFYNIGDRARLRASAGAGYEFVRWSGDTELLDDRLAADTLLEFYDRDVVLAAVFRPIDYNLTLKVQPQGSGIAADLTGSAPYRFGDRIEISARAETGYRFAGWRSDVAYLVEDVAEPDTAVHITRAEPPKHRNPLRRLRTRLARPAPAALQPDITLTAVFEPDN